MANTTARLGISRLGLERLGFPGGANITNINAVTAVATASFLAPTIRVDVIIQSVTARATASMPAPSVTVGVVVTAVPAIATASFVGGITIITGITIGRTSLALLNPYGYKIKNI